MTNGGRKSVRRLYQPEVIKPFIVSFFILFAIFIRKMNDSFKQKEGQCKAASKYVYIPRSMKQKLSLVIRKLYFIFILRICYIYQISLLYIISIIYHLFFLFRKNIFYEYPIQLFLRRINLLARNAKKKRDRKGNRYAYTTIQCKFT